MAKRRRSGAAARDNPGPAGDSTAPAAADDAPAAEAPGEEAAPGAAPDADGAPPPRAAKRQRQKRAPPPMMACPAEMPAQTRSLLDFIGGPIVSALMPARPQVPKPYCGADRMGPQARGGARGGGVAARGARRARAPTFVRSLSLRRRASSPSRPTCAS
jgi:hypothetical protein